MEARGGGAVSGGPCFLPCIFGRAPRECSIGPSVQRSQWGVASIARTSGAATDERRRRQVITSENVTT